MPFRGDKPIWAEAFEMLAEAERLQRQCFRPVTAAQKPTWEPPVDLIETADALLVTVALPGIAPKRVDVHLNNGQLIVSGMRPLPQQGHDVRIHRLEIPYGHFERRIPLPPGRYELTGHGLLHGCLQLNLHKI